MERRHGDSLEKCPYEQCSQVDGGVWRVPAGTWDVGDVWGVACRVLRRATRRLPSNSKPSHKRLHFLIFGKKLTFVRWFLGDADWGTSFRTGPLRPGAVRAHVGTGVCATGYRRRANAPRAQKGGTCAVRVPHRICPWSLHARKLASPRDAQPRQGHRGPARAACRGPRV